VVTTADLDQQLNGWFGDPIRGDDTRQSSIDQTGPIVSALTWKPANARLQFKTLLFLCAFPWDLNCKLYLILASLKSL